MIAMPGRYRLTLVVILLVLCIFLRTAFAITVESDFYEYRHPHSQVLPSGDDIDTLIDLEQPFPVLGNLHSNLSVSFSSAQCCTVATVYQVDVVWLGDIA